MSHDCPYGGRGGSKSLEGRVERTDELLKEDGQIYCADPSPLTSLSVLDASTTSSGGAYVRDDEVEAGSMGWLRGRAR